MFENKSKQNNNNHESEEDHLNKECEFNDEIEKKAEMKTENGENEQQKETLMNEDQTIVKTDEYFIEEYTTL